MRIDLGMKVVDRDGDGLGSVERIVLDANTKQMTKLVVGGGLLDATAKLVDIDMVRGSRDDELVINLPKGEFEDLPDYVEEQFVTVPDQDREALPFIIPSAMGAGSYLYGAAYAGRGYEPRDSFYDAAPANAPIVENRSNIPEGDVMISEGTDVVGADGDKIGTVDEVIVDEHGRVSGFTVKAGLIFKREVRIPIEWVQETSSDHVLLSVSGAEAEARSFDIEDSSL